MFGASKFRTWLQHPGYNKGGKGGGSSSTTVTKSDPWVGVQPYIESYLAEAAKLRKTPYSSYDGQRISGFTPQQQLAMQMTQDRAIAGSPVMNAAQRNVFDTLQGSYLNPESNPYLKQNVNAALGDASSFINQQFNKPGAFGGTAHQGVMSKELGGIASQMYGANYDQERNRQMQANLFAPQMAQADYTDAQALAGVGDTLRGYDQDLLNQAYTDWYEQQQYPFAMSDYYRNAILAGQGAGGVSTTTGPNPYQSSPIANALGGAAMGAGIGTNLIAPMMGAAGLGADLWGLAGGGLGLLFSDKRVKTDIKKVGKTDEGLNVYTYRYKWGGPMQMGVMAQEVAKKKPEAVGEMGGGILGVNYGLLGG